MFSATKKLTLGLVAGFLLSTVPAQEAQAFAPIAEFKSLTPGQQATLVVAAVLTPYLMNFLCRKPLTTPRFDKEILLHGSVTEKAKQLHYFFVDVILGWPRKENKPKTLPDDEPGKFRVEYVLGQEPSGLVGNGLDQLDTAAKALAIPAKTVGTIALIGSAFMWLMKPSWEMDKKAFVTAMTTKI